MTILVHPVGGFAQDAARTALPAAIAGDVAGRRHRAQRPRHIFLYREAQENLLPSCRCRSATWPRAARGVAALRRHQRSRLIARSGRRAISCANSANGWTNIVIGHGGPIRIMLLNRHGPDPASADGRPISPANSPTLRADRQVPRGHKQHRLATGMLRQRVDPDTAASTNSFGRRHP